ncbi:polyprenyl synthetase family protein [Sunxiuqinia sp. A32]|uniref:polyprenyl synthetase family protein n=1 Tax=Sunxiuqinia sp. A32 TaxID=3461496 RepID=UPI00404586EB
MSNTQTISEFQKLFAEKLEKEAANIENTEPKNLYEPISYTLKMGGKRLRPVMVLMANNLFGGNIEKAMPAALAIEIFHNFTLLHDDMMDNADMRRNHPSVHKKYNDNVAILSGDAMSIMAYQYLVQTESPEIQKMVQLFSKTAMEVCEGQQYDMNFEDTLSVSIDDYLNMIRLKTAVLIACSLKLGAINAGADTKDANHLYNFGINLGLAFQLQDDLLDVFADEEKFGKKIGGDITSNKKTFLLLKALELSSPAQKETLINWIEKKEFDIAEKIAVVKNLYTELGLPEISKKLMEDYYQSALEELSTIKIASEKKEIFIDLAKMIMKREH